MTKKLQKSRKQNQTPAKVSINGFFSGYEEFLRDLKARIRSAQIKAALSVNRELILLYWEIGSGIVERQEQSGWGEAVVEKLAKDLRHEFPEMKGLSARNLWDMRRFYEAYRDQPNLRQLVAEITLLSSLTFVLIGKSILSFWGVTATTGSTLFASVAIRIGAMY